MKTAETLGLERRLHSRVGHNKLLSCTEVTIGSGHTERIDYVAVDHNGIIRCFEIKVSKADFRSPAACSFVGDYNYYALPPALVDELAPLIPGWIGIHDGNGIVRRAKRVEPKITREAMYLCLARSIQRDRDEALQTMDPTVMDKKNRKIAQLERENQDAGDMTRAMEILLTRERGAEAALQFSQEAYALARGRGKRRREMMKPPPKLEEQ